MKFLSFKTFVFLAFCTLSCVQINAGSIKYYGSKAGWFRPCKGDLVAVCKEVITNTEDELKPQPAPDSMIEFNNIKQESNNQEQVLHSGNELIILYDGIEYTIPIEAFNWEDGSIDVDKL